MMCTIPNDAVIFKIQFSHSRVADYRVLNTGAIVSDDACTSGTDLTAFM